MALKSRTEKKRETMSGASSNRRKRGLPQAGVDEGQGGAKRLHKEGGKAVVEQPGECLATCREAFAGKGL